MSGHSIDVPSKRDWPTGVALGILVATFTLVAGPEGAVAGVATALTWVLLGLPYAIAVGHVVLVAAFPGGVDLASFLIVEAAFVLIVLVPVVRRAARPADAAVFLVSAVGLIGATWFAVQSQPLWIATGVVLTLFTLAAYTLHRYELVRLGLVTDDHPTRSHPESDP